MASNMVLLFLIIYPGIRSLSVGCHRRRATAQAFFSKRIMDGRAHRFNRFFGDLMIPCGNLRMESCRAVELDA
jgi:hypothetical protein